MEPWENMQDGETMGIDVSSALDVVRSLLIDGSHQLADCAA